MQQTVQQQIELTFVESQMYSAIRDATPEQQAELRTLAASQSLAEFTRTLQQCFPQYANYITEKRVRNVVAYDQQYQAQIPATPLAQPVTMPTSQQPAPAPAVVSAPTPAQAQPIQPARPKHGFKYHFYRSTYITIAWDWFMMLAGVSAEAVLTFSVIYSCARLLPALHTPLWLDNLVFVAQMVALDVGGLSLRKMANQAERDGNTSGSKFAGRVSNALITIMVLNVVLSVLQGVAKLDAQVVSVVEGILLVARAVLAVLYATVIHSLRDDDETKQTLQPGIQASDIDRQIGSAIANVTAQYDQRLAEMRQQIEAASEAKWQEIMRQSEARFASLVKQKVVISEAKNEAESEAKVRQQIEAAKRKSEAKNEAVRHAPVRQNNVLTLRQPGGALTAKRKAVYRLVEQDKSLSSYDISEKTGVPVSTVQRYLRERREAKSEATGTK